ncbi:Cysteine-rich receptor-like protein kinase [Actinidia chinensis var. chinensis]|uniref:Cysteine-rich receptor-like protein kinase n=1 Tax=Actinidia chinensis var. chinensis TaxID=1590841 RepID=A0A2R6RK46_ACTCC|nr:Cysteine-rich receptor-like protein kinase [Actinidia chinensis var. chinensis]
MTFCWQHTRITIPKSQSLIWLNLISFLNLLILSLSDPRISEVALLCGTTPPPRNPSYIPNFVKEMENLSLLVASNHWGQFTVNSSVAPIFGLAQCHRDLSNTDCLLCYAVARTRLPHCLPAVAGRIFLDGCFLRYDSYNFFNETIGPRTDKVNCSASGSGFRGGVGKLVANLTRSAVENGGFAVGEVNGVFGLAQCWESVSVDGCRECLEKAVNQVRECGDSREGRVMNAGCYVRYSTSKFFNDVAGNLQHASGDSTTGVIVCIALGLTAFFMFSFFVSYACYVRFSRRKEERSNLDQVWTSFTKSSLNFKYETLEKATDYFNSSRKIGQGGAGSVFKGTLPNGEVIAVKRLFFNTRQWVDEFFNEVNLIRGIQHKNLVKLLGCSIEGPESLLVYEYVQNKSLDRFLFDKEKVQSLNWKQRFDIIVGTAEGLAYLHGGTETRIIHRDIKSSNVLLDENLAPKISDFGLARCFGDDKSHLSTGIAGTLGYMAPEYLVRGQLTEKADVYSYGVLVLEIVCGRKNNASVEESCSLLQRVWQLYKGNRLAEAVDPRMRDNFPETEASIVLQVGLLCTQASVALRPSMAEVVRMLINMDWEIPVPNQPPFLSSSTLNPASSVISYSANSFISSPLTKIEVSSTESSSRPSSDGPSRSEELKQN